MDQAQLKDAIGKPQLLRLKQLGSGIKVGKVLGARVLIMTVDPRTDLDRVEEEGIIMIPKWVKKENTPMPTTGVILEVGPELPCQLCGQPSFEHSNDEWARCKTYSPTLSPGDMVMFPKFSGSDFQVEEQNLRIVESKEILCTLVDTQEVLAEVSGE